MTEKPYDPFHFVDEDFIEAVVEVGESLHNWRLDSLPVISASASRNRFRQLSSTLKMNALAKKLREGANK